MAEVVNGAQTPKSTPMLNGKVNHLSLTEYAADPSPHESKSKLKVPEAFLLPDGTPDVNCHFKYTNVVLLTENVVYTPDRNLTGLPSC